MPNSFCYPIWGMHGMQLLDPECCTEVGEKTAQSPLVHLWNEHWRQQGVDFLDPPPIGSFVEKLYGLHGLDGMPVAKIIAHETNRLKNAPRDKAKSCRSNSGVFSVCGRRGKRRQRRVATAASRNTLINLLESDGAVRALANRMPVVANVLRNLLRGGSQR